MTTRSVPPGTTPDAWLRWVTGWHIAFGLMLALAGLRLLIVADLPAGHRWLSAGLLVVLAAAYTLVWEGPERVSTVRAYTYLAVAIAVTGLTCWLDPGLSLLLFIVYPHVWVYCGDSMRLGIALTLVLTLSAGAGFVLAAGWSAETLRDVAPSMLVSLLFSLLLGLWVWRIIEQSQERGELIAQLEATRSQLAEAHHAQGVMAERERMAREIHDTLAQGFASVVMLAQAAATAAHRDPAGTVRRLEMIESVSRENLAEARALVAAFAPVGLDGSTLPDALRRLAERFGAETGLVVDVEVLGEMASVGRDREVVLLRAAQEALTNVRRHARANRVTVRLIADEAGARVEVGDDGVGFTPASVDGYGLAGMRGRVREAGGEVDVASAPGRGTRVTVRVPLSAALEGRA